MRVASPSISAALVLLFDLLSADPARAYSGSSCDEQLGDLRLRQASELVDSAWAHDYLTRRASANGGTIAVVIRYGADGTLDAIDGMPSLKGAARQELAESIGPYAKRQGALPNGWAVTVGMGWWETGVLEVLPVTVTCEPQLQNRAEIQAALAAARRDLQERQILAGGDTRVATFQLAIVEDGSVRFAQLIRPTGVPPLDQALRDVAKRMRFSPATMGSQPVRVIRQQRISLRGPA
jgi:TonB family protein